MKKLGYILISLLKNLLILWIPILLIEETFLNNYILAVPLLIISVIICILCLILYIKSYKKIKINYYLYNITNTILLVISNIALGYFFYYLTDIKVFHHCLGSGWDCFMFGIEYQLIGIIYAAFSIATLLIWLFVKLIKNLKSKK